MIGTGTISGAEIARRAREREASPAERAAREAAGKRREAEAAARAAEGKSAVAAMESRQRAPEWTCADSRELTDAVAKLAELRREQPELAEKVAEQQRVVERAREESSSVAALARLKSVSPDVIAKAKGAVAKETAKLEELRDALSSVEEAARLQASVVEQARTASRAAVALACEAKQAEALAMLDAALRAFYAAMGLLDDVDAVARRAGVNLRDPRPGAVRRADLGVRFDSVNQPYWLWRDMLDRNRFDTSALPALAK